jgi:hypothetical protein
VPADDITSLASVSEEVAAGRRRFREELKQIPTLDHEVYGSCLAPVYPSQLLIALGQLASLPIGAWRGQASIDWGVDPSLVRRYRQRHEDRPGSALNESSIRAAPSAPNGLTGHHRAGCRWRPVW